MNWKRWVVLSGWIGSLLVSLPVHAQWTQALLDTPAEPESGQPFLTRDASGSVYLSWLDKGPDTMHRFRWAKLDTTAKTWSALQTIAEGDNWFVNWADVPSLAVGADGHMVAHWLQREGEGTYAYGVQVQQSFDGGVTWSSPAWLHDDQSPTEHGFATLLPGANGTTWATWLDGRNFASGTHEMTLRARQLGPQTMTDEVVLDALTCECCPADIAALPNDGALVVYRNRTEDEVRDIWAVRYDAGQWSVPYAVSNDEWQIAGCPVNGPAVDARGEQVAMAWFTAAQGKPVVKLAFSEDGGAQFSDAIHVDDGQPLGRVDVVLLEYHTALVSWLEKAEVGAQLRVKQVRQTGETVHAFTVAETSSGRASGYPRMISAGGTSVVFAWRAVGETYTGVQTTLVHMR